MGWVLEDGVSEWKFCDFSMLSISRADA